jgi:predicted TPR repeat methyltransferase
MPNSDLPANARPGLDLETLLGQGYRWLGDGAPAAAADWFRRALALAPASPDAQAGLAEAALAAGETGPAVCGARRANLLEPEQPHWLPLLAEALESGGQWNEAVATWRRIAGLRPNSGPVLAALGAALRRAGRREEAADALQEAVLLDPEDGTPAAALAAVLIELDRPLEALERVQPSLRLAPSHPGLAFEIGRAWVALGETAKAGAAWQRCLELDPLDRAGAAAAIANLETGQATPPTPVFVRALFDRYAERFDHELLEVLGYQAPERLFETALGLPGIAAGGLDILDLGCGTGLLGVLFHGLARRLVGIDLSPRMLAVARRRGLYHQLEEGDLMTALAGRPEGWDLILAADVFNYVGDLAPVMRAAARALRPDGWFLGTLEKAGAEIPGEPGFAVMPTRRYAHHPNHLDRTAAAAGLTVSGVRETVLRREQRQPVIGLLFVLRRED